MNRLALAVLVTGVLLAACTEDRDPSAGSSVAITTTSESVATTVPPTTPAATTTVASTTSTTAESTTTTEPPPVGWVPIESLPSLAYPPCCGSNWSGAPSPEIPSDPTAALPPGIYFAERASGDTATDAITFEVSRFESCANLPDNACESGPFGAEDVGVVEPAARTFTLPMDATIRVGVSGFECAPDQQTATGAELGPLMAEFDRSYQQLLGGPFESGDSPEVLYEALAHTPAGGFAAPECAQDVGTLGSLVWRGAKGPPVLMQTQFSFDPVGGAQVAPKSASAEWLRLTAIAIDADGWPTLYFYAGFYS